MNHLKHHKTKVNTIKKGGKFQGMGLNHSFKRVGPIARRGK